MKTAYLITSRNSLIKERLNQAGYLVVESVHPLSDNVIGKINKSSQDDCIVVEFNDSNPEMIDNFLDKVQENCRIICIVNKINDEFKKILLLRGVSDVINSDCIDTISSCIKAIGEKQSLDSGKIVIYEDDENVIRILKNIILRFNYEPVFINDDNALFDLLGDQFLQLVLLNIGMENINIKSLINRTFSCSDMKKLPVISYKDMNRGIYVHEIISGLNRLTKVILSHEELYSFLLDILYRKRVMPLVKALNYFLDYDDNTQYTNKTLRQVYNSFEHDIFSMKNILQENDFGKLHGIISMLEKSVMGTSSLLWLKIHENSADVNTCGLSGRS